MVEMLAALTDAPIDIRDGALLALGYVFGLRRSELVALDWQQHGVGDGYVRISARAIDLVLIRSKTATAGKTETVAIPRQPVATAVAAIETWIRHAGVAPGTPILRHVHQSGAVGATGLHPQSVALIVKRRIAEHLQRHGVSAEQARAEAASYSGH